MPVARFQSLPPASSDGLARDFRRTPPRFIQCRPRCVMQRLFRIPKRHNRRLFSRSYQSLFPQLIYFHIHTKPRRAGPVWRCRTIFQLKKRRRDRSQGCNRSPGWDESIEEARPVSLRCFTRASSPCEYFVTGDSCVFVRHGFSRAVTGDLGIVGHGFSRAVTDGRNTDLACLPQAGR